MRTLFLLLALTLAAQLPVGTVLAADDGSEAEDEDEEDGAPGDSESPSTDEDSAPAEDAAQVEAGESPMGAE